MSHSDVNFRDSCEALKEQELSRNSNSYAVWAKYKSDLIQTKSLLISLPKKICHNVMVPIGPKALMQGVIVHTNEYLVNLGNTWFAKRSAFESLQICDRRLTNCNEMLKKLEKEKELIMSRFDLTSKLEAFGNQERPEIIEFATEEEISEWKEQHRIREREYRQKLANLRNQKKQPIKTEEDLWNRLNELELQEELEDELNRLDANSSLDEELPGTYPKTSELHFSGSSQNAVLSNQETKKECSDKGKRRVSFACDIEDPLRLEITHTAVKPGPSVSSKNEITSPSDIFQCHLKNTADDSLAPFVNENSLLKGDRSLNMESKDNFLESKECPLDPVKDIKERDTFSSESIEKIEGASKKLSKFKKSRPKNTSQ